MRAIVTSIERQTNANNRRLAELVDQACLTQAQALERFNRFLGPRPLSLQAWKGYFVKPESSRYRYFRDEFLAIAEMALSETLSSEGNAEPQEKNGRGETPPTIA